MNKIVFSIPSLLKDTVSNYWNISARIGSSEAVPQKRKKLDGFTLSSFDLLVAKGGIEPPTQGFSVFALYYLIASILFSVP
ncbi:MAG: hypothetical protein K0S36_2614 [Nitrosospira multiformis]|jgi:hypothetical protein|nr:hypothetical protein [Nitrosospira multiformis]